MFYKWISSNQPGPSPPHLDQPEQLSSVLSLSHSALQVSSVSQLQQHNWAPSSLHSIYFVHSVIFSFIGIIVFTLFEICIFLWSPFLLNVLGWHWLIKLYRCQVYNSITHSLYTAFCFYHPKSNLFSWPHIWSPLLFPPSPCPPFPLVATILLPVSMSLFFCLVCSLDFL